MVVVAGSGLGSALGPSTATTDTVNGGGGGLGIYIIAGLGGGGGSSTTSVGGMTTMTITQPISAGPTTATVRSDTAGRVISGLPGKGWV